MISLGQIICFLLIKNFKIKTIEKLGFYQIRYDEYNSNTMHYQDPSDNFAFNR